MRALQIVPAVIAIFIAIEPVPTYGQGEQVIEEVLVTAQKRQQSVQDVSIAMAAFDSKALTEQGLNSLQEVVSVVPSVELFDDRGSGQPTWVIRGVGLSDFNANNTPTAAIFYDEVYLTSNALGGVGLFDVERVEVLKGPQGGLYGRNATGGAVRVISARPDLSEFNGYAQLSYGRWGRGGVEGAVGGPIIEDKLAYRAAVKTEQGGGWQDSLATPEDDEHGNRDFQAFRGQLLYATTVDMDVLLKVDIGEDNSETPLGRANGFYDGGGNPCAAILSGRRDESSCIGLHNLVGDTRLPSAQRKDGSKVLSNPINELENSWTGYNLQVSWDLGYAAFKSISSYIDFNYVQYFDYDGTPLIFVQSIDGFPDSDSTIEQWSQEFRLTSTNDGPFTWLAGAIYAEDTNETEQNFATTDLAANGFTTITQGQANYKQDTDTWALYGQVGYDISSSLNINGSLRYTDEEKEIDHISLISEGGPFFAIGSVQGFTASLEKHWSGHIGLDWHVSDNAMVYAKLSRGFKSGGFFAAFTDDTDTLTPYREEINDAIEIGIKSNPTEQLQVNAAVFYYDYKDAQGGVSVVSAAAPTGVLSTVSTVGDAEHSGVELDLAWAPEQLPGFSLQVATAWLDAEITDSDQSSFDQLGNLLSLEGRDRNFAPEYSYSVNARQEINFSDSLLGTFSAGYSWRDDPVRRSTQLSDVDYALLGQDSYGLLNLRVALAHLEEGVELSLLGENVTDKTYTTRATGDDGGSYMDMVGRPASWTLQLRYDF